MRAEIINLLNSSATPDVRITHGNEEIIFSVSCYGRTSFQQEFSVFDQINLFWLTMTEEEQATIFNTYRDIAILFQSIWDRTTLTIQLNKKVVQLLDLHDFDRVYDWVLFKSPIIIPNSFATEYVYSVDKQGSRERTYIRSDFTKLIALSVILRSVIPVWGEFISYTRRETGTVFKEYYAFQLINHSKILHSEPFETLRTYIEHTVANDRNNSTSIMEGISSEDFPTWILALVSIRRLCIGDIRGLDERANLVTFIHKFITGKMKGTDISADNVVKKKTYDEGGSDPETKLSTLERYKVKHDISIGEIVELEYSVEDMRSVAFRLSSNMTDELLNRCMESSKCLINYRLLDPQIMLLRWVFKPVISPRGMMYLNKITIVKALGVLQAVLWARGYKYLALLSTSYANVVDGELHIANIDSRARITKENMAALDTLYPYNKITGGKKSTQKPTNLAVRTIDTLADNLGMISWMMTADSEMIAEVFAGNSSRRFQITYDIKNILAQLVIELGSRSWK